jgi:integrase
MADIVRRHSNGCPARTGGKCACRAGWEASVYIARDKRKLRKTFQSLSEARSWRAQAAQGVQIGAVRAPTATTLRQAATEWLDGARSGAIRNRSGDEYKPSVIRGYDEALKLRVLPAIGAHKLSDIAVADVQALVDRWQAQGLNASTIRNTLLPLRVIYRRAVRRGVVAINPAAGVEMPAVRGKRDRIVSPEDAAKLLDALQADRALWATALYAGLRRGELRALRWADVDLASGLIHVRRSWDQHTGEIAPKSRAGVRRVPIPARLRDELVEHRMSAGGDGLVFGREDGSPFNPSTVAARAERAWKKAKLQGIGLHEARHTFASLMIAAGVNAKALSTYMGHANIAVTFDRYGHLMPGDECEAAQLLDAYLQRADTRARLAEGGSLAHTVAHEMETAC